MMGKNRMSDYERNALAAIHEWKSPKISWFNKFTDVVTWPLAKVADFTLELPMIGEVIQKSISGLVDTANDVAQYCVRQSAIFEEYQKAGHNVQSHEDILSLDLEEVDRVIGYLAAKYKATALVEGGLTGAAGLPAIPADIAALVVYNLRAIGEYSTYCGFDVDNQQERLFVLNILGAASSPTDAAKVVAMAQLVRIAKDVAAKRSWKKLSEHGFVQVIQHIFKALGIRLTKAKLAQAIPATGAIVGAGFNAYFTSNVCDTAFNLYRERFLAAKYGDGNVIETTTVPADNPDPDYPENYEEIPVDKGDDMIFEQVYSLDGMSHDSLKQKANERCDELDVSLSFDGNTGKFSHDKFARVVKGRAEIEDDKLTIIVEEKSITIPKGALASGIRKEVEKMGPKFVSGLEG